MADVHQISGAWCPKPWSCIGEMHAHTHIQTCTHTHTYTLAFSNSCRWWIWRGGKPQKGNRKRRKHMSGADIPQYLYWNKIWKTDIPQNTYIHVRKKKKNINIIGFMWETASSMCGMCCGMSSCLWSLGVQGVLSGSSPPGRESESLDTGDV